jgi:hypothetical protein
MTKRFNLLLRAVLSASFLLAAPIAMSDAHAQDAGAPTQIEREFWASTREIGTDAAYRAYLGKFPDGFFAALASAAIKKGIDAQPDRSPSSGNRSVSGGAGANPNFDSKQFDPAKIAGPTASRAITQQIGDVFYGPGPITVGWLGSKKQIVVPAGRWVLLFAEDGLSTHVSPIPMTTLILARMEAGAFRSFLHARFNNRTGDSRARWGDAMACEEKSASAPFAWHETGTRVTQCVTSALRVPANPARFLSNAAWKAALQTLTTAGGTHPGGAHLFTEMFYTGDLSNYLKVTRIDFGVLASGAGGGSDTVGQPPSIDLSVAARQKWAEAYSPLAALGYRKKLAEEELYAGTRPSTTSASLPE